MVIQSQIPVPGTDEVLVENLFISLDAGFLNWLDEDAGDEVLPAMELVKPVMGLTISRVIQSTRPTCEPASDGQTRKRERLSFWY